MRKELETLAAVLVEISESSGEGCLKALVGGNVDELCFPMTPTDLKMKWGKGKTLHTVDRRILKSLLVMDGAVLIDVAADARLRARKQVKADVEVFDMLNDDETREAAKFGTRHRSALAFSRILKNSMPEGSVGLTVAVSADGNIRVFEGGKFWELTDPNGGPEQPEPESVDRVAAVSVH